MVALKFALAFALVSISVSNPIEELGIEDEDFVKKGRNAEEDEEAARNARFNFGYSIQVWQFLSSWRMINQLMFRMKSAEEISKGLRSETDWH